MNRAERRRQEKAARKPPVADETLQAPRRTIQVLKTQLQQATSPEDARQIIATLVAQGLPVTAGEELAAYAAEYHEAAAILQSAKDTEAVTTLVDNAYAWADHMIDRSPERDRRACRAGCAFCCYLPVVLVTAAEAARLADWLHIHCSPEEMTALRQRLADRNQQHTGSATASPARTPLPCALLQDNRCMAYAVRPLKCRGWTSLRREDCEQAYGPGQSPSRVPVDTYAFVMGNAVLNGVSDSVTHGGLDGTSYDLTAALARALEMPNVMQRWRDGERLFAVS
jgi:Fe-S-cluster containining protein